MTQELVYIGAGNGKYRENVNFLTHCSVCELMNIGFQISHLLFSSDFYISMLLKIS